MNNPEVQYRDNKKIIIGECPRCLQKGYASNLHLWRGVKDGRPWEMAKCEVADCGYTETTFRGKLVEPIQCPKCNGVTRSFFKKNGQHYFRCPYCNSYYLADKDFKLVEPPPCRDHGVPMKHTNKKDGVTFYWKCPVEECGVTADSDMYGAIVYKTTSTEETASE